MLRRFGFFLAVTLVAAAPVAGQDRPVQLTIGGGFTGVYGDGADHVGNGGNFTIGALFKVSPVVALQGEYGWNGMKQKNLKVDVAPTPIEGGVPTDFFADANMQYGAINALFSPKVSGKIAPYGITGLGLYYRPVTISTPSIGFATICDPYWYVCFPAAVPVEQIVGKRSSTDFGMNFGGGVNFKTGEHTSIYAEVRYHYIWGPEIDQTLVPQPLAGSLAGKKANGQFLPITIGFRF
jgi:opacity protein-like surface antigen